MSATRNTFKVHFYVKWKEVQPDGKVPIFGRITINGEPKTFSTQQSVTPNLWDIPSNRAKGKSVEAKNVNDKLDDMHTSIKNTYDSLKKENPSVTSEEVRNTFLGIDVVDENKTILYQLDEYYKEWGKRVKKSTAERHVYYRNAFAAYIPKKYGVSDLPFTKLNKEFLVNYYNYLLDELNYSSGTAYKAIQKIQRIGFIAVKKKWVKQYPFGYFAPKPKYKKREYLSDEDLITLMNFECGNHRRRAVRDMFVFCCFTGLCYVDLYNLTYDDIKIINGKMWLIGDRQKTLSPYYIKLLPIAVELIERYRNYPGKADENRVFPVKDRDSMTATLKRLAKDCGLKLNISTHTGRHTFGTTITLTKGIQLETLSKMMGHKHIKTTRIYAEITARKVEEDMNLLDEKIGNQFELAG